MPSQDVIDLNPELFAPSSEAVDVWASTGESSPLKLRDGCIPWSLITDSKQFSRIVCPRCAQPVLVAVTYSYPGFTTTARFKFKCGHPPFLRDVVKGGKC